MDEVEDEFRQIGIENISDISWSLTQAKLEQRFESATTDEERIASFASVVEDVDLDPAPVTSAKSESESVKLREDGNRSYRCKRDHEAVRFYTASISVAPFDSSSIALALAYANRSAVLKSMGFLKECIADIERALDRGYPKLLGYKLFIRQAQCFLELGLVEKATESFDMAKDFIEKSELPQKKKEELVRNLEAEIEAAEEEGNEGYKASMYGAPCVKTKCPEAPLLSYGQNQEAPSASNCVAIKYSKAMGRHLVATRDIAPGDVVIVEEPYAAIVNPDSKYMHCCHCFKRCHALLPCPYCASAMFCSSECQDISWDAYHRLECSLSPAILSHDKVTIDPLSVRTIAVAGTDYLLNFVSTNSGKQETSKKAKRTAGFNSDGLYLSSDFTSVYHLVNNSSLCAFDTIFGYSLKAACIIKCLSKDKTFKSNKRFFNLVLRLLLSLACNAHEIGVFCETPELASCKNVGSAIYSTTCLLNHSCDPNVARHSYGKKVVIQAICPIKKGCQVFDNFGYYFGTHLKSVRQSTLLMTYCFTCDCEPCHNDWPLGCELPEVQTLSRGRSSEELQRLEKSHRAIFKNRKREFREVEASAENLPHLAHHLYLLEELGMRFSQDYALCKLVVRRCFASMGNRNYCL